MSRQLYGGHFQQASDLANTLIHDINPWLPHMVHFGWNYLCNKGCYEQTIKGFSHPFLGMVQNKA